MKVCDNSTRLCRCLHPIQIELRVNLLISFLLYCDYSQTYIKRPLSGWSKSGLSIQVVFQYRLYLNTGCILIQVVSQYRLYLDTGFILIQVVSQYRLYLNTGGTSGGVDTVNDRWSLEKV